MNLKKCQCFKSFHAAMKCARVHVFYYFCLFIFNLDNRFVIRNEFTHMLSFHFNICLARPGREIGVIISLMFISIWKMFLIIVPFLLHIQVLGDFLEQSMLVCIDLKALVFSTF